MHTYKTKFSSGLVITLLALSGISFLFVLAPAAPVAHAANAQITASMDYPYTSVGAAGVIRDIAITNPLGNAGIVELNVNVPAAAANPVLTPSVTPVGLSNYVAKTPCSTAGTGPWTAVCESATSGDTILPAGAEAHLPLTFDAEAAEAVSGTADAYTLTVTAFFTDGTTQTLTLTLYEGAVTAVNVAPAAGVTTFQAGSSVTYTMTFVGFVAGFTGTSDSGVPLSWFSSPSVAGVAGDGFAASFTPGSFTTSSATSYTSSFTTTEASSTCSSAAYNDNGYIDSGVPCGYFALVDAGTTSAGTATPYDNAIGVIATQYGGVAINRVTTGQDKLKVAGALAVTTAAPTQVSIITCYDQTGYSISVVNSANACALTMTLADKYGNPVSVNVAGTVALTVALGTVWCTDAGAGASPHTCSTTNPEGVVAGAFDSIVYYEPVSPSPSFYPLSYGTYDVISAALTVVGGPLAGPYAGVSKTLRIGNLFGATAPAATSTIYDTPYAVEPLYPKANVEAGTPVNLAGTYGIPAAAGAGAADFTPYSRQQSGVPINMSLTTDATSVGTYTGTFSNHLSYIIVPTDSSGVATANFTADTVLGDAADAAMVAADPTTASVTGTGATADVAVVFTTGVSTPSSLLLQADTYTGTGKCPTPSTTTPSTYASPGSYMCLDVLLQDVYGNSVNWAGNFALQITLATSAGSLSGTTVYIVAPNVDTFTSGYQVEFTAPSVLGTVTISASTTQAGIKAGTDAIDVVTVAPMVSLTPPAVTTVYTATPTINVTAIPSPAAAKGVVVIAFTYSLNGAANVTAPLTATNATGAGFTSFAVTLTMGANTLKVYATDSVGNVGVGTFTITLTTFISVNTYTSTGAASCTSAGFTGDCVTFTNTGPSATDNVFFVWYSSSQVVSIGAQLNVAFASGGSASFFSGYTSPGTYTVKAFVQDTAGNALSIAYAATVTIS